MDLHFDPIRQKWSLRFNGKFYIWEGDAFDRAAAEVIARQIIFG